MTATNNEAYYCVVIPAAGIGSRFQADRPKQYTLIDGEIILKKTINFFLALPNIKKIVVALHTDDPYWSTLDIQDARVMTVTGGVSRAESVLNGLLLLQETEMSDQWVLVHDACRPFICKIDLENLIHAAKNDAVGGILATPSTDTLKRVVAGRIVETVDRETIWRAQTPQMFRLGILSQALQQALHAAAAITDEASAIEWIGLQPMIIEGSVSNRKLTFSGDLGV